MFDTLDAVLTDAARRLIRGANDRKCAMHVPVVVTSDIDARAMVLRAFDRSVWTLRFHTDTRAPKVAAIAADPRMALLFYDKGAKIQLRVRGTGAILCDDPLTDAAWASSTNFARRCYLGEGPGVPGDAPFSGLPCEFEGIEPSDAQLVPARAHFAVLLVTVTALDWLHLAHTGHVRAQFARQEGGDWEGSWVTP